MHPLNLVAITAWGVAFGLLVIPAVFAVILAGHEPTRPLRYVLIGLVGAVLPIGLFLLISWWPRIGWRRWVDVVVGAGHCASCGQSLDGLAAADDGCRVCPECGAAWNVLRRVLTNPAGTAARR